MNTALGAEVHPTVPPDRPTRTDVVLVGVPLLTLGPAPLLGTPWWPLSQAALIASTVLGVAQLLALLWRRVRPNLSAAVVSAAALAHVALGQYVQPSDLAVLLVLYAVTVFRPRQARWWLALALAGAVIVGVTFGPLSGHSVIVGLFVMVGCAGLSLAAWALGLIRRARALAWESLSERAAHLEREHDQQTQLATQAERTRIAREMHDLVAHSLTVLIAQADGGRYAARADPDAAESALRTISETGRAALTDMRQILGVLRTDGTEAAELVPEPREAMIADLIASMGDTMEVSLVSLGTPRPMPIGTGAMIYRIAQESLTNVLKHAGPDARVTVIQQWSPQQLVLQVDDDGRGAAATPSESGHGLLGMHERAAILGGSLVAGPRPGGGFRVRLEVPLGQSPLPEPATDDAVPTSDPPAVPAGAELLRPQ